MFREFLECDGFFGISGVFQGFLGFDCIFKITFLWDSLIIYLGSAGIFRDFLGFN